MKFDEGKRNCFVLKFHTVEFAAGYYCRTATFQVDEKAMHSKIRHIRVHQQGGIFFLFFSCLITDFRKI